MNVKNETKKAPAWAMVNGKWESVVILGWYGLPENESDPAYVRISDSKAHSVIALDCVRTRDEYVSIVDGQVAGRSLRAHQSFVRRHYSGVPLIDVLVPHIGTLKAHAATLRVWHSPMSFRQIGA